MFRRGVFLLFLAVTLAACSHDATQETDVISAGQLDIKLPPGWKVTADGARRPAVPIDADAPGAVATGSTDTVPLKKEDATTSFFESTGAFTQCLKERGTTFHGA